MDPAGDGQVISESGSCLLFDGQNALGQWVAETCCGHADPDRAGAGRRDGGGAGVEPLRRGGVVGAEDARGGADRDRDVQRVADRSAVAGERRAARDESDLRGAARAHGCSIWRRRRWRRARFSRRYLNGQPEIPAGMGVRFEGHSDHGHGGGVQGHADAARRVQGKRSRDDGGDSLRGVGRRRDGERDRAESGIGARRCA